jgi:dipeptidyl aminopeptidase/acylaminoacyl peptidase
MLRRTPETNFVRHFSICMIALGAAGILCAYANNSADAQNSGGTRLLRTPTVSATQIAFAYAQNIWVTPRSGGQARRVTSFQGQTSNPHFSPDGNWIAFSGEYAGNLDVYVVPAEEGVAPDIDVENWPKDVIAGRDPQLERAVTEAMRLLKERAVDRITREPPPPTWGVRPKQ